MIYNFCKTNPDLQIHGLSPRLQVTEMIYEEFLENIILTDKEMAQTLIIVVAPICLRISIDVFVLDLRDANSVSNNLP